MCSLRSHHNLLLRGVADSNALSDELGEFFRIRVGEMKKEEFVTERSWCRVENMNKMEG